MAAPLKSARYENSALVGRNLVFVDLAAQGRRILEFGCSTGFLSRHLVDRGCRVTGVEIDAEAAEAARKWCEKVHVLDLNQPDWPNGFSRDYDTILFGDVLEHLMDPENVLRRASDLLLPSGRVIICLPNIAHWRIRAGLLRGKFEYTSAGILDVTHLRFYTCETARKMIEEAGYRILSTHPILGGGRVGNRVRRLFPGLFTVQTIFVTQPL
ncbi:MAG TPA: class I SAM-dependent methyltransferase [Candidatus Angelobacter sp.]|nr:class I SAM-dependent methyltransferase [Candidatus Angelobacter sp.]